MKVIIQFLKQLVRELDNGIYSNRYILLSILFLEVETSTKLRGLVINGDFLLASLLAMTCTKLVVKDLLDVNEISTLPEYVIYIYYNIIFPIVVLLQRIDLILVLLY